jgi:hypothetical protein
MKKMSAEPRAAVLGSLVEGNSIASTCRMFGVNKGHGAGVADREWTMVEFVKMLERAEVTNGGRLMTYKPAASKRRAIESIPVPQMLSARTERCEAISRRAISYCLSALALQ